MPLTAGGPNSCELITTLCNGKIFMFVVSTFVHRSMLSAAGLVAWRLDQARQRQCLARNPLMDDHLL
ncbi:MAG TPA: hypothetical protein VKZ53_19895 [Candidatus Angelobacter sp.]|nr:hypothetical protein [Candidatus Angelobacter sp.]